MITTWIIGIAVVMCLLIGLSELLERILKYGFLQPIFHVLLLILLLKVYSSLRYKKKRRQF